MTKGIVLLLIILLLTLNYPDTFSITYPLKSTFFAVAVIRRKGFLTNGKAIFKAIMNVVKIRRLRRTAFEKSNDNNDNDNEDASE